jgi:autotransporter-associated beta strand protein
LTVTCSNIYTGGTSINAGILAISGAGSIAASPVIDIGPSATLQGGTFGSGQTVKGTGKLAGTLTIGSGAILSPAGDAATGTMDITGTLVLGGTVRMQIQKSGGALSEAINSLVRVSDLRRFAGRQRLRRNPRLRRFHPALRQCRRIQ